MAPLVWIGFEASAFTSLKAQQSKPGSLAKTPYLSNWARAGGQCSWLSLPLYTRVHEVLSQRPDPECWLLQLQQRRPENVKCIILFYYFYDHEMIVTMSPYRHRWWWCWSCIHRKVAVLQALHSVSLLTSLHPSPGLHLTMWLKRLRVAKGAKMWLSYVPSSQPLLCTGYFICSLFILT